MTVATRRVEDRNLLAVSTRGTGDKDESLHAVYPIPSDVEAEKPLEALSELCTRYGMDLPFGEEPTRLIVAGQSEDSYESFRNRVTKEVEGKLETKHEWDLICLARHMDPITEIGVLFGIDITALLEDM